MTTLAELNPFTVTIGKYAFMFSPDPGGGFSVSRVGSEDVDARGATFEEALRNAFSAAAKATRTTRRQKKRYALEDILDSFAPAGTYGEVDFGGPKGGEIW